MLESFSLQTLLTTLYLFTVMGLMIYGINAYVMVWLFRRRKDQARNQDARDWAAFRADPHAVRDLPTVTVQLPLYNEQNVATRIIASAGALSYPRDKLFIQILDDSTDDTRDLVDRAVAALHAKGVSAAVIRRRDRNGYKAGALQHAMPEVRGDFVALFDSDFVPPADFLLKTTPFIARDPNLACLQARWGHINREQSLLTRAQAVGIDGHFGVEQGGRCWNNLFMNFNGTGGIWRTAAIRDGGGWQADTLTEDMDLSYRVQLKGWRIRYLMDVVAPAELPESLRAFQRQQFRWAKGSIETAKKLGGQLWTSKRSLFEKTQAFLHMTHYAIHPLMLLSVLLAPWVLYLSEGGLPRWFYLTLVAGFCSSALAPNLLYATAVHTLTPRDAIRRLRILPFLSALGVSLCVNNTRAVFEALWGRPSAFLRTPKTGSTEPSSSGTKPTGYVLRMNWSAPIELALALYAAWGCGLYLYRGHWMVGPFLFLYMAGFTYSSVRGFLEGRQGNRTSNPIQAATLKGTPPVIVAFGTNSRGMPYAESLKSVHGKVAV